METYTLAVIFGCAVLGMVIGSIWYGPLFGNLWMRLNNLSPLDEAARKQMQKEAMPLYGIQFVTLVIQLFVLSFFVDALGQAYGVETALWLWLGFMVPVIAGLSLWNMHPNKVKLALFLLSAGYNLVCMAAFGFILSMWG